MLAAIQRYVPGLVILFFLILALLSCIIFLSLFPKLTNIRLCSDTFDLRTRKVEPIKTAGEGQANEK